MDVRGDLLEVVPRPRRRWQGNAAFWKASTSSITDCELLPRLRAINLPLMRPPSIEPLGTSLQIDGAVVDVIVHRQQQPVAVPLGDGGVVLLHQVGQVAARGVRRHLGEVVGEARELVGDRDIGVHLLEQLDRLDGAVVAILRAPPGETQLNLWTRGSGSGRRRWLCGSGRRRGGGLCRGGSGGCRGWLGGGGGWSGCRRSGRRRRRRGGRTTRGYQQRNDRQQALPCKDRMTTHRCLLPFSPTSKEITEPMKTFSSRGDQFSSGPKQCQSNDTGNFSSTLPRLY